MASRKPKGIDGRTSSGFVIGSSEDVFKIETHRMQNCSYAQKKEQEHFWFSKQNSDYFNSPKTGSKVHVVFNNQFKEFIETIYTSKWDLIYSKY